MGLEGWYEVSDSGCVRRIAPGRSTYAGKTVIGYLDKKGYRRTTLTAPGIKRFVAFHTLVAESFLSETKKPGDRLVRHLDGDKSNNTVSNLAWGTDFENAADEVRLGRSKLKSSPNRDKTHCPRGHEYTESNTRHDDLGRRYCRSCRRENWHRKPKTLKEADERHGTANGYLNYKCRCEPCTEAHTIYQRSRARQ